MDKKFSFKRRKVQTKGSSQEDTPYRNVYDYSEEVNKIPSHRILAINREKRKVLQVKIVVDEEKIIKYLEKEILKANPITDEYLKVSIKDSLKRLIYPSIEREVEMNF